MSRKANILEGQSLYDFAIQHTGNAMNAHSIAVANNVNVSDIIDANTLLTIVEPYGVERQTQLYYKYAAWKPASVDTDTTTTPLGGIGYMGIGIDFFVR